MPRSSGRQFILAVLSPLHQTHGQPGGPPRIVHEKFKRRL
jgi:hypothetical protein